MARSSSNSLLQRELLDTIKELRAVIEDLRKELAASKERERLLQEQIEGMNRRFFGRSSEKHMVQSEGQLDFFNEVELEADKQQEEEFPYEAEPELLPGKGEQKRKPRTPRKEMFKGLAVEEEIIDLPEDQRICTECGAELELIGQRIVRETLKYVPARLTVVRTIARVYGCPKCKEEDNAHIVNAETPDALIPHSYASESVVSHAMYQKFANAVPLYRQEKDWEQMGAFLSRGTLGRWIKICSDEYFAPLYEYFHRLLVKRQFAMADETRIQVLKEPERNPETDSFMWLFRSGEDGLPPLILYRYTETRAKFNAVEFLNTTICRILFVRPAGPIYAGIFVMPFRLERKMICQNRRYRASSTVTDCLQLNATAGNSAIPMRNGMNSGRKKLRRSCRLSGPGWRSSILSKAAGWPRQ